MKLQFFKLYMDGQVAGSVSGAQDGVPWLGLPFPSLTSPITMVIPKYGRDTERDELAWYNRALTSVEINEIMTAGVDTSASKQPFGTHTVNAAKNIKNKEKAVSLNVTPNPFSTNVDITFLSKGEKVIRKSKELNIEIYDIAGKLIKKLCHAERSRSMTSSYSLKARWDAGSQASGVYLIQATIGNKIFKRRIMLIK
jgi:hypothetical protein